MLAVKSMQWRHRCRDVAACRKYFHTGTSRGSSRPLIVHQRCAHGNAASRGGRHTAAASKMCYSNNQAPLAPPTFSSINFNKCCQHSRSFSKFSPEEVVIQDPPPPPPPTSSSSPLKNIKASPASSITSVIDQPSLLSPESTQSAQPQKIPTEDKVVAAPKESASNNNKFLLDELHDAQELFHRIYAEAKALLRNNKNSTTSEEIVAMADYFMILVNSLDLEKSLETIQSLQTTAPPSLLHGKKQQEGNTRGESNRLRDGEGKEEVEEKLRQAVKSMNELHHVFLTMVESALPPRPPMIFSKTMDAQSNTNDALDDGDSAPSFDKELYTFSTVGRALQLSRRAVELGMPMHRQLFQRMATGVVLTASFSVPSIISSDPSLPPVDDDSAESTSTEPASTTEPASVILPGQYPQIKEVLQQPTTPPIALKLLGVYHHARTALNISSGDQLHHLAMELLAGPFLLLLEQKRWEEAMGLLRGWRAQFGNNTSERIDFLGLLGENNTLDALEIAKGWLVGDDTDFAKEVQSNAHVMDLTTLLEVSVAEILEGRKQQEEKLSQLLWQLSLRSDDDDDNLGAADSDSDSDFEDDFDYDSDGEEGLDTPNPASSPIEMTDFAPSDSPAIRAQSDPQREVWRNENTLTLSSRAEDTTTPAKSDNAMGEAGESTIIWGLSNKEARECIYLRNGGDWVLPDIVPTLEEWNKGNQLTFTPEFERYLGRQIMRDAIIDDDDDDED